MKTAEEILIDKVGKLALSGLKWKSLNDRKQLIIEAMSDFAAQSVREYKEELAKKNSLDQFLEVYQKLVFTECEKAVYDYKEKLKAEIMSMRMNRRPVTANITVQVVIDLIESTH